MKNHNLLLLQKKKDSSSKDVDFNIQIVEGDSGKAISNMNFLLRIKVILKSILLIVMGSSKILLQR